VTKTKASTALPTQIHQINESVNIEKQPGDDCFPITGFSITISRLKQDVSHELLHVIGNWIKANCVKGVVSTEVGKRAFNLHLQICIQLRWPGTPAATKALAKIIKSLILPTSAGYKVFTKEFGKHQTFIAMVGYCTKDQGKSSHKIVSHNVSAQELSTGRRQHTDMVSSFEEHKDTVTPRNLMDKAFKFTLRSFPGIVVPIHYVLTYMIQTGDYVFSSEFVSTFKKVSLVDADELFTMMQNPGDVRVHNILALVFNQS